MICVFLQECKHKMKKYQDSIILPHSVLFIKSIKDRADFYDCLYYPAPRFVSSLFLHDLWRCVARRKIFLLADLVFLFAEARFSLETAAHFFRRIFFPRPGSTFGRLLDGKETGSAYSYG